MYRDKKRKSYVDLDFKAFVTTQGVIIAERAKYAIAR